MNATQSEYTQGDLYEHFETRPGTTENQKQGFLVRIWCEN